MAPTIHLVRHAQGYHNLCPENEWMRDPELTPLGIQQCADLGASFPHHGSLRAVVASAMRRTLSTAMHAFGRDGGVEREGASHVYPIIALDNLQEVSDAPSDTGSTAAALEAEFGVDKVDVSRVREGWTFKGEGSFWEPTLTQLPLRAREARQMLREIVAERAGEDGHIAVVSHGAFLHFLTEDWHGLTSTYPTSWKNAEYRSFQFVDPTGKDEDAAIRETVESWKRRQGETALPTPDEQRELRQMMERELSPYFKVKA